MKCTTLRLRCLSDAEAAINRKGLSRCCGGYRDAAAPGECHPTATVHELERAGYLECWGANGTWDGGVLHITEGGKATLERWREESAKRC